MNVTKLFAVVAALLPLAGIARADEQKDKKEMKDTKAQMVVLSVTEKGFEPANVTVKKGEPVMLMVTRKTKSTCAKEIVIASEKIHEPLPLDKEVSITFTPKAAGDVKYGCGMDMITGTIHVE